MRIIVFIFFLCIFSCKETASIKKNQNPVKENVEDSLTSQKIKKEDTLTIDYNIVIDSIYKGASFYEINSFKDFQYIDIDPYEDFLIDRGNMYNIIVYQKNNMHYVILSVLEKNIGMGELSNEWKNTKKTIIDYITYPKEYKRCWSHSFKNEEDIECCLYVIHNGLNNKFRVWRIDFENQKFKYLDKIIELECY